MTSTETKCRSTLWDRPVRACGAVRWTSPNGDAGSCIVITGHIIHSRTGESGREQILRRRSEEIYNTSSGTMPQLTARGKKTPVSIYVDREFLLVNISCVLLIRFSYVLR